MFENILVPLDGSRLAECVIPHAIAFGEANQSQVHLLRVVVSSPEDPRADPGDPLDWKCRKMEAEAYLERIAARFLDRGIRAHFKVGEGQPAEAIVDYGHGADIDLVMLSSHGRDGLTGWNMSSVVQKVILRAQTSIMLIRAQQPDDPGAAHRYRRILLPLDGSRRAESVLPTAVDLSRSWSAELLVAHVVERPEMPRRRPLSESETALAEKVVEANRAEAAQYLSDLKQRFGLPIETHLYIDDRAAARLHRFVDEQDVDLVVLTAHGFAGDTDWPYGSIVTTFLVYGTAPLMVYQDVPTEAHRLAQPEHAAPALTHS